MKDIMNTLGPVINTYITNNPIEFTTKVTVQVKKQTLNDLITGFVLP